MHMLNNQVLSKEPYGAIFTAVYAEVLIAGVSKTKSATIR